MLGWTCDWHFFFFEELRWKQKRGSDQHKIGSTSAAFSFFFLIFDLVCRGVEQGCAFSTGFNWFCNYYDSLGFAWLDSCVVLWLIICFVMNEKGCISQLYYSTCCDLISFILYQCGRVTFSYFSISPSYLPTAVVSPSPWRASGHLPIQAPVSAYHHRPAIHTKARARSFSRRIINPSWLRTGRYLTGRPFMRETGSRLVCKCLLGLWEWKRPVVLFWLRKWGFSKCWSGMRHLNVTPGFEATMH